MKYVKELEINYDFKPGQLEFPPIPVFKYKRSLSDELKAGNTSKKELLDLLEQMLMARVLEEMIAAIKQGGYEALPDFDYFGPTHVSIGQEAASVGAIAGLEADDYITSSHRGHSDAMAKGYAVIKKLSDKKLLDYLKQRSKWLKSIGEELNINDTRPVMEEKALRIHVYRMISELFGKKDGYCGGIGGSMHIADFSTGHLGANAIVGGHFGIATGAAMSCRYRSDNKVVLCLAGDGACNNGLAHEAMNMAAMAQFENGLMDNTKGVPIVFGIINNQYGMSGQFNGEISGIDYLCRRAPGYNLRAMRAEVVNGMDVMAVRDAAARAVSRARKGQGPVFLEFITYRYKGHSLSDPAAYRTKEEVKKWQARDAIESFYNKLKRCKIKNKPLITAREFEALKKKVWQRNVDMAVKAAASADPEADDLLKNMYCNSVCDQVPVEFTNTKYINPPTPIKRDAEGKINYRSALKEALIEEMSRDNRIVLFGEDVAEYGGAFGVSQGLIDILGRDRIFNTAISESAIIGAAVGMAMNGMRPIAEIMYADFILMAMDQIGNQAAKWQFMSAQQIKMPLVIRTAIGGGRGYAGQHSQSPESITAHIPGLKIVAPWDAYDAKGLLKSAIRDDNPVVFYEHQLLYNPKSVVPEEEYFIPIGQAKIRKQGKDVTIVTWSYCVGAALEAAQELEQEGIETEVIDLRTLVPWDQETVLASVRKTGRCLVVSQAVAQGSYTGEIASTVSAECFDSLDAPVLRLGAMNCVSPSSVVLEDIYLPSAEKIVEQIKTMF
ncbi:MAG: pyruvate dehydrogenase [Candidatus Omnitrophica bacterium]|nr:pyruvate dehydrogenase [Candidatus Omnitrophota bacterium]